MDISECKEPTFELHTTTDHWRFFDTVEWPSGDKPDTVTLDVARLDYDVQGEIKDVHVRKGELVEKLRATGATAVKLFGLFELSPDQTIPFKPHPDSEKKHPQNAMGRFGTSGYYRNDPTREVS